LSYERTKPYGLAGIKSKCQTNKSLTDLVTITYRFEFNAKHYFFFAVRNYSSMNQQATASQKTRAEQETENESNRLREQIDAALAVVAVRSPDEVESLRSAADRIERAARDLADALRQLAQQRKVPEIS
jgi:DNA-binding transcriptional regulator GbsR (MarR family)